MIHTPIRGAGTALITPFRHNGEIDEPALRRFVAWQIEQGIQYLVPCGSTGEAMTLTLAEHRRVVEITVDEAAGRLPVIAGAGSNDTAKAIELSKLMASAGATHLLHTSPMYNKPPQRGIVAHFRAIADVAPLPVVLYNVPGRTGSNMEAETTLELAEHANIIAMKEASGSIPQVSQIIRNRPDGFTVLSGDDVMTLAVMAEGGDGVISVTSNVSPRLVAELCIAAAHGDFAGAKVLHHRLAPWTSAAFVESNPIPVKAALAMMGMIENVLRLPLVPLLHTHTDVVRSSLVAVGALGA
ncbi:MAG TPA: 4-hydroxy-tetrahydrodipicolinate synthase [Gemmatimonadaceae bacterium]|jgi:4-hydroxy-tetrahydrodipicolinate synthase|nr:4-hydroxy-tetrahydrodipicolinate synthase [Gemmatimonadaceae bacterium]